jgi:hypothetical protein
VNFLQRFVGVFIAGLFEHTLLGVPPGDNLTIDNRDLFPAVLLDIDDGQDEPWFFLVHKNIH